jgi:tRNA-dihydrouridine synthase A
LRYDWVFRLKQERPVLRIVLNGGLSETDVCLDALQQVDGVMIGRAAYQDPYRLHRLHAALFGSSEHDREHLLLDLQDYVMAQCASGIALKHISKCLLGLFHGQPGGRLFRQILSQEAPLPGAGWPVIAKALAATRIRDSE